jgi:hypothetical protein
MKASGFFGLMRMDTLIINPTEIDLPLYSYDRIFAMGNDTLIVELYDTLIGEYSDAELKAVKESYKSMRMEDVVYFNEPMNLKADMFEYSLSDGSIRVTNKSDTNVDGDIYIYYKNYSEGLYRGGITYRVKIAGGLKAGESKEASTAHFTMKFSRLMSIQYAG